MSSNLQFPSHDVIYGYLNHYPFFQVPYYQETGITKAISELAAKRFGNRHKTKMEVKMESQFIIYHLQLGKDGFTGETLQNFGRLGIDLHAWAQIANWIEKALNDCANSVTEF